MIPDLINYAFTDRNYNMPQTIDQNKILMQIKKRTNALWSQNTEMRKELNNKSRNQTSEY